jgi:hypothetical protein
MCFALVFVLDIEAVRNIITNDHSESRQYDILIKSTVLKPIIGLLPPARVILRLAGRMLAGVFIGVVVDLFKEIRASVGRCLRSGE